METLPEWRDHHGSPRDRGPICGTIVIARFFYAALWCFDYIFRTHFAEMSTSSQATFGIKLYKPILKSRRNNRLDV
jgi:hypothetical protein